MRGIEEKTNRTWRVDEIPWRVDEISWRVDNIRGECSRLDWDMDPSAPYNNMGSVHIMYPSLVRRRRGQRRPYVPRPPAPDMPGPYGHGGNTYAPVIITRPQCYRDERPPVRAGPSAADLRARDSDAILLVRLATSSSKNKDNSPQGPLKRKAPLDREKDPKR